MKNIHIEELKASDFDSFAAYLDDHLSDNGAGSTGYFQPLSRDQSSLSIERADALLKGLKTTLGNLPWRRAWVARNSTNTIVGHVDLKAYPEPYTSHRCLLGLGVDRSNRKQGIGIELLQASQSWAINVAQLEWIYLQVLSSNYAAIHVYSRLASRQSVKCRTCSRYRRCT